MLLSYRIPRKLGTPRVTIWRKMKRLGVAQLGDGLVALPATAHTREDLDCIAEEILQVGGTAAVWLAQSASDRQERELCASMAAAPARNTGPSSHTPLPPSARPLPSAPASCGGYATSMCGSSNQP